jgi:hypothetical protein
MKKWLFLLSGVVVGGGIVWFGLTTAQPAPSTLPQPPTDNIAETSADTRQNAESTPTGTPTAPIISSTTVNNKRYELCVDPQAAECELRNDIDLAAALWFSPHTLDNNVIEQVMMSTNFDQMQLQLLQRAKSSETITKQAAYQQQFLDLQQQFPTALATTTACTEQFCTLAVSQTDNSQQQALIDTIAALTPVENGHLYVGEGKDAAGNIETRILFALSPNLEAVFKP